MSEHAQGLDQEASFLARRVLLDRLFERTRVIADPTTEHRRDMTGKEIPAMLRTSGAHTARGYGVLRYALTNLPPQAIRVHRGLK